MSVLGIQYLGPDVVGVFRVLLGLDDVVIWV